MSYIHLSDAYPVARKSYRCLLCELFIPIGTKHVARRYIADDKPQTIRMHILCEGITRHWRVEDWECFDPVEFRERLEKNPGELAKGKRITMHSANWAEIPKVMHVDEMQTGHPFVLVRDQNLGSNPMMEPIIYIRLETSLMHDIKYDTTTAKLCATLGIGKLELLQNGLLVVPINATIVIDYKKEENK